MCSCCLVSHIRREPGAETKDVAEASEASLLHPRQKLGAGGVLEAGGTRAGEAIEPMT